MIIREFSLFSKSGKEFEQYKEALPRYIAVSDTVRNDKTGEVLALTRDVLRWNDRDDNYDYSHTDYNFSEKDKNLIGAFKRGEVSLSDLTLSGTKNPSAKTSRKYFSSVDDIKNYIKTAASTPKKGIELAFRDGNSYDDDEAYQEFEKRIVSVEK